MNRSHLSLSLIATNRRVTYDIYILNDDDDSFLLLFSLFQYNFFFCIIIILEYRLIIFCTFFFVSLFLSFLFILRCYGTNTSFSSFFFNANNGINSVFVRTTFVLCSYHSQWIIIIIYS